MPRLLRAIAITFGILLALPGLSAADETWQVVRNVRLYTGPSTLSQKITTLHAPELVTRVDSRQVGSYIHVRSREGVGWVYIRSLTPTSGSVPTPTPNVGSALPLTALAPGEMRAHFIDVGQGQATLLEFSCGAVLIDTGGEKNDDFDSTDHLLAYLTAFFAERPDLHNTLDLLVLSHPHIDHTRGVSAVLDHFTVRNAVDDGLAGGSGGPQQALLEDYAQHDSDVGFEAIRLDRIPRTSGLTDAVIDPISCSDGDPKIRVLWGKVASDPGWGATEFGNPNNHSVAVRIDYGAASFFIPGDLEESALKDLVHRYAGTKLLDVDVYEAGHHGSRNGTTTDLVAAMSPKLAVISMGPATRERVWTAWKYGHPNTGTLKKIAVGLSLTRPTITVPVGSKAETFEDENVSAAIYATGWDGNVLVTAKVDGTLSVHTTGQPPRVALGNP